MTPEEKLFNRVKIAFVKARIPKPMTTAKSLMKQIYRPDMSREQVIEWSLQREQISDVLYGFAANVITNEGFDFWSSIHTIVYLKNL